MLGEEKSRKVHAAGSVHQWPVQPSSDWKSHGLGDASRNVWKKKVKAPEYWKWVEGPTGKAALLSFAAPPTLAITWGVGGLSTLQTGLLEPVE